MIWKAKKRKSQTAFSTVSLELELNSVCVSMTCGEKIEASSAMTPRNINASESRFDA